MNPEESGERSPPAPTPAKAIPDRLHAHPAPIEDVEAEVMGLPDPRTDPLDYFNEVDVASGDGVPLEAAHAKGMASARGDDPWAHRRGEPRVFALLWTMYVLVAVAGSVLWLATTGRFTVTGYGPAARIMLVVVAAGVTLVWPMTRLSQLGPDREAFGSCVLDVLVVLFPVQMVLWPLVFIAGWPRSVVISVAVQFLVWGMMIGALIAVGVVGGQGSWPNAARVVYGAGMGQRRTWVMLVIVAMIFTGPMVLGLRGAVGSSDSPEWLLMCSPFTALPTTTGAGVSGPQAALTQGQRWAIVWIGAVAAVLWGVAAFRAALARHSYQA